MEAIVKGCCGLDVHQASVVAWVLVGTADSRPQKDDSNVRHDDVAFLSARQVDGAVARARRLRAERSVCLHRGRAKPRYAQRRPRRGWLGRARPSGTAAAVHAVSARSARLTDSAALSSSSSRRRDPH